LQQRTADGDVFLLLFVAFFAQCVWTLLLLLLLLHIRVDSNYSIPALLGRGRKRERNRGGGGTVQLFRRRET
jgi:hypothetical protein